PRAVPCRGKCLLPGGPLPRKLLTPRGSPPGNVAHSQWGSPPGKWLTPGGPLRGNGSLQGVPSGEMAHSRGSLRGNGSPQGGPLPGKLLTPRGSPPGAMAYSPGGPSGDCGSVAAGRPLRGRRPPQGAP